MVAESSILLPAYNGALYLRLQLDSRLGQTLRDFELLIHDDGSTDASASIFEEYAARDSRIRLERDAVNLGQGAALARLLPLARGRFIAFSDQDDVWDPEKLARLRAGIGEAALAYGSSPLIDADGREKGMALLDHISVTLDGVDNVKFLFKNSVSGHALLARREMVDPSVFLMARPYDWLIATIASFAGGVVFVKEARTYHRMHANNQLNRGLGSAPSKYKRGRSHWRANCLAMRETLTLLMMSPVIAVEKRRIFRELHGLVSDELVSGGLRWWKSCGFPHQFMTALAQLHLDADDHTYLSRRLRGLRGPLVKVLDRMHPA
jgi:glycosyltransferase involved in cell wall biosynthesis